MSVSKKRMTTKKPAETMKLITDRKNESLASPFAVLAPATHSTHPTKSNASANMYKILMSSTGNTVVITLRSGKNNISVAKSAHKNPSSTVKKPTKRTTLRADILEYGCCPSSSLAIF